MSTPSPFAAALEAIRRPLGFASRAGPEAARVQALEATVREGCARAASLAIPVDARRALEDVAALFAEPVPADARRARAAEALARIDPLADPAWAERALERSVSTLPGVGPRRAERLEKRGIASVLDLLLHLPVRYDDRRHLAAVRDLVVGHRASFLAHVLVADFIATRGRGGRPQRAFQAVVGDGTGTVNLRWFHGGDAIQAVAKKGATLLVTGEVRRWRFSKELLHPEVEPVGETAFEAPAKESPAAEAPGSSRTEDRSATRTGVDARLRRIVPEYASPEGLHPRALRRIAGLALAQYADLVPGFCPASLVHELDLPAPADALRALHEPDADADAGALEARRSRAHERLVLEELTLLETGLAIERAAREREPGIAIGEAGREVLARAGDALPFALTNAQRRVCTEIVGDLERAHPMSRLLQGDVGSGKTAVAFLSALACAASGLQTALMAPTELLAEQHAATLARLADSVSAIVPLRSGLLTASVSKAGQGAVRRALQEGSLDLVVGTHALVQAELAIPRLGLAIVAEQHRFGVTQRAALRARRGDGRSPHLLVMTATPIPRTLALTLYGDLDVSVIDELPPGRVPVRTDVLRAGEGERVVAALREATARGEQVYVVYPLIEESEKSDLRAASAQAERIARHFPELHVDLVHGRLDAAQRGEAMARFARGETQVLVSTTVIEVGVDVPNATLMIVEHAERFGLAQLHQLRGRVGRGLRPGRCLLVARSSSEDSEARLRAMTETTDGFLIAEADLRIRGPGEFLGTRQSGRLPDLRMADLLREPQLIAGARDAARETIRRDPALARDPALRRAVARRWGERLALISIG